MAVDLIFHLADEIFGQIARAVTGRIYTKEQIRQITNSTVGKHFTDLFPPDEEKIHVLQRVADAERHIALATQIVGSIQHELDTRKQDLQTLIAQIEENQKRAEHAASIASANEQQIAAFKREMEVTIRNELVAQANQNRRIRQAASFILWLITLIAGAALGAYFLDIVAFLKGLFTG